MTDRKKFSFLKSGLMGSSTMPVGTGGAQGYGLPGHGGGHHHHHHSDGSCCHDDHCDHADHASGDGHVHGPDCNH